MRHPTESLCSPLASSWGLAHDMQTFCRLRVVCDKCTQCISFGLMFAPSGCDAHQV